LKESGLFWLLGREGVLEFCDDLLERIFSFSEVFCIMSLSFPTEVRVLKEFDETTFGDSPSWGMSLENDASTSLSVREDGRSELGRSEEFLEEIGNHKFSLLLSIHLLYGI
jgi:hypothetical protein